MKLAIDSGPAVKCFGEEKGYRILREAGFDGVDLSMFEMDLGDGYREHAFETKRLLDACGLTPVQAHAPFNFQYGMKADCSEPHYLEIVRAMEYAAIVGAPHIVIHGHPCPMGAGSTQSMTCNLAYFRSFLPYAEQFGIRIALENLRAALTYPYLMRHMLEELNDPRFCMVYDTGHANYLYVPQAAFFSELPGGTVAGMHIHDNTGKWDDHMLPGTGVLPWDELLSAMADYGYDGCFTLELPHMGKYYSEENMAAAYALAAATGRKLINRLEQLKSEKA